MKAKISTFQPGFSIVRSPGEKVTIGVPGGTTTWRTPEPPWPLYLMSISRPLALATKSRLPSALNATAEGYQPVGSRPVTKPRRGSTNATELRPPSAT